MSSAQPDWADFEPTTVEEVVGLALISAGIGEIDSRPDVLSMDRQTASEIVEALRVAGYLPALPVPALEPLRAAAKVFIGCPYCSEVTGTLCASHRRDLRAALGEDEK